MPLYSFDGTLGSVVSVPGDDRLYSLDGTSYHVSDLLLVRVIFSESEVKLLLQQGSQRRHRP